jgi:hypothetical protein
VGKLGVGGGGRSGSSDSRITIRNAAEQVLSLATASQRSTQQADVAVRCTWQWSVHTTVQWHNVCQHCCSTAPN